MNSQSRPLRATAPALAILVSFGAAALAGDTPRNVPEPAPGFARDLLDARKANARAQHEGRPSVWMAVPMERKPSRLQGGTPTGLPRPAEGLAADGGPASD